jgi:hypothetical protein
MLYLAEALGPAERELEAAEMSRAPQMPIPDRLDPEKVAYWYFRLNGFCEFCD